MILEIEHGCFGYPKQKEILKDINLHLEKGHILSVLRTKWNRKNDIT